MSGPRFGGPDISVRPMEQTLSPEDGTVRRFWIRRGLPLLFCLLPLPPALVVAVAIPEKARAFYLKQIVHSQMDWLILGLGLVLFLAQLRLSWQALQWRGSGFDERAENR